MLSSLAFTYLPAPLLTITSWLRSPIAMTTTTTSEDPDDDATGVPPLLECRNAFDGKNFRRSIGWKASGIYSGLTEVPDWAEVRRRRRSVVLSKNFRPHTVPPTSAQTFFGDVTFIIAHLSSTIIVIYFVDGPEKLCAFVLWVLLAIGGKNLFVAFFEALLVALVVGHMKVNVLLA